MLPRRAALAALLVVPLAACGTPSRIVANEDVATRRPHETVVPTVFPSKTPTPTPAASGATGQPTGSQTSAPPANPNAVEATLENKFLPPTTTVKVGTEVTWTNVGAGFHTVTGGEPDKPDMTLINGQLTTDGATYKVKFAKAGTYKYFCQPHAGLKMVGEVVVK